MENIVKISKGNYHDVRIKGNIYARWEKGFDVCIEYADGKEFYYQLRNFDHDIVERIDKVKISDSENITWDELNLEIKKVHFKELYPNAGEEEIAALVYGKEFMKKTG